LFLFASYTWWILVLQGGVFELFGTNSRMKARAFNQKLYQLSNVCAREQEPFYSRKIKTATLQIRHIAFYCLDINQTGSETKKKNG